MIKINKLIKLLNNNNINTYQITNTITNDSEMFFDRGKLETIRKVSTNEILVQIFTEDGDTQGQADFVISKDLSTKEINELIATAILSSKLVHNKKYELVKGEKKQSYKYKDELEDSYTILQKISKIYFDLEEENLKFNSLECFFKERTTTIINSNNVNLSKKTYRINVEAIPSYYSKDFKTELYRMFNYDKLDYDKIKEDVIKSLNDLRNRGKAIKFDQNIKTNVILRAPEIRELFTEYIDNFNYADVYFESNLAKVGDVLQTNPKTKLNLSLDKRTKADFFDNEGIILKKLSLIEDGKLVSYYGSQRFASYLNLKATGDLTKIVLKNGTKSIDNLRKEPYIELIDLSGLQVDAYSSYIGGEVRLAIYFDGTKTYPISGFSFSGNLNEVINNMELSKEKEMINDYEGPSFMKIPNIEII